MSNNNPETNYPWPWYFQGQKFRDQIFIT